MKGSQERAKGGKTEDVWTNAPVGRRPFHRPAVDDKSWQKVSDSPGEPGTHTHTHGEDKPPKNRYAPIC